MKSGCLEQVSQCRSTNRTTAAELAICAQAENMCSDNVEGPYYAYSGRGVYDIRHPLDDPTPPSYFMDYLNLDSTRAALGVNLNYSGSNNEVYYAFQRTGDIVYPNFLEDVEMLLKNDVRVALFYGDADYICNWYASLRKHAQNAETIADNLAGLEAKPFPSPSTTPTARNLPPPDTPHSW